MKCCNYLLLLYYELYPLCFQMKKQAGKIFKNFWIAVSPTTWVSRDDVENGSSPSQATTAFRKRRVKIKYFRYWKFLLTIFFFWFPLATNAASLEIAKVNNAKLIRQFEELASLKGQSSQEVQLALGKATQNLLTYLVPDIKKLNDFNAMFFINCTVFFDSNDVNKIKCDVDFSAINPDNQTDPGAIILRENIKQLRNNNIFITQAFLNCSSDDYLLGTNELYFKQPWDWTETISGKTPTFTNTKSHIESKTLTISITGNTTVTSSTSNTLTVEKYHIPCNQQFNETACNTGYNCAWCISPPYNSNTNCYDTKFGQMQCCPGNDNAALCNISDSETCCGNQNTQFPTCCATGTACCVDSAWRPTCCSNNTRCCVGGNLDGWCCPIKSQCGSGTGECK